ncbi:hypothetical protein DF185_20235 [Marinifilum breve]|uniref:Uncharacterized protein n=1 Tax=Marinifilum breve TaxID=2184082 RepID=A0A2V4A5P8_9BACT|nr:hypothetical protein [Marinifilum breve]PXX96118.1 hypothetical protein DF185_20235 [Marinifilum breve]
MNNSLSYDEKCSCAKSTFCIYVSRSQEFENAEKDYLVKTITKNGFSGILYVSSVLAGWALIAGIIDSVLFPGIIVYAIFHGVVDYKVLTPPILFLVGNILAKLIYIAYALRDKVKLVDVLIAALPYAGSAYLLRKFLVKDKLMRKAVNMYLTSQKNEVKKKLLGVFSKKQ